MTDLWDSTRAELRRQLGDDVFDEHFGPIRLEKVTGDRIALRSDDEMCALLVTKRYRRLVERCAEVISGTPWQVEIAWNAPADPVSADTAEAEAASSNGQMSLFDLAPGGRVSDAWLATAERPDESMRRRRRQATPSGVERDAAATARLAEQRAAECGLSPRFDFGSFVVGGSNEFAFEAARAVVERPAALYNPLFIYGGVGLGKTHLMNAIGIEALRQDPSLRIRYVSAEQFVNEVIESIGRGREGMEEFRHRHRVEVDMLLIDDVQFIAGKERTQEEFFHTFNALHQAGRQIVLTSDRTPQEMPALEERLVSRLTMGLLTDVQAPDYETRIAILRRKAGELGFDLPADVVEHLARNVSSNVRELHGVLLRIGSFAKHRRMPITLDVAKEQLARVVQETSPGTNADNILKATCEAFGVSVRDVKGRRRTARIAQPRKVAMYLARTHTAASYPELGAFFGRDHTTVIAAVQSVEREMGRTPALRARVENIERRLGVR